MDPSPDISPQAAAVLACLPQEPATAVISEIAQDIFRLREAACYMEYRAACGRVRRAMNEIARHFRIYRDYRAYDEKGRPVAWGQRERYGIARNDWQKAQSAVQRLMACQPAGAGSLDPMALAEQSAEP